MFGARNTKQNTKQEVTASEKKVEQEANTHQSHMDYVARRRQQLASTPQPGTSSHPNFSGTATNMSLAHHRATPSPTCSHTNHQRRSAGGSSSAAAAVGVNACSGIVHDINARLKDDLRKRGGASLQFLVPKMSSFVGDDDDDDYEHEAVHPHGADGVHDAVSPVLKEKQRRSEPSYKTQPLLQIRRVSSTVVGSEKDKRTVKRPTTVAELFGGDIREMMNEVFTPARAAAIPMSLASAPSSFASAGGGSFAASPSDAAAAAALAKAVTAPSPSSLPLAKKHRLVGAAGPRTSSGAGLKNTSNSSNSIENAETWNRLSALPKHVQERVRPVWRHRAGAKALKEGEEITELRPVDRLRVLRHDPLLRRDFRMRVASEQHERTAIFNAKLTERLTRQRETDISVACSAVAQQTDKIVHDEDEGRGPGFSGLGGRSGGKGAAPSGRIIRQYFEHATREMHIWRRAQRLSTVEERGKQLQHSRDLRFEEELMQTEKASDTRAGETELEIRENFFATAVVIALTMIEWHGRALDVLNPKTRSVRCLTIRLMVRAAIEGRGREVVDRYPLWKGSQNIPANACMYARMQSKKKHAACVISRAWKHHRHSYFEAKKRRSATIIRSFMRDIGKVLSFTVATRRLRRMCILTQHHWRGRIVQREARKELLILQLHACCVKQIEQLSKDIERYTFQLKAAEKEAAGRRGAAKLAGAESSHRVIADMQAHIADAQEYMERLHMFRELEVEDVAWKWVLRLVAEYDHKLVRYVNAFSRYRVQAGIPHGTYNFVTEQAKNSGVPRPTRPFFRRLLPEEDVKNILLQHCGAPGELKMSAAVTAAQQQQQQQQQPQQNSSRDNFRRPTSAHRHSATMSRTSSQSSSSMSHQHLRRGSDRGDGRPPAGGVSAAASNTNHNSSRGAQGGSTSAPVSSRNETERS